MFAISRKAKVPKFEITHTINYRQYARVVDAVDFEDAERQCISGEFVSGMIMGVIPASDKLVEDMRLRIGEALEEISQ